jgi:hypothetical protein
MTLSEPSEFCPREVAGLFQCGAVANSELARILAVAFEHQARRTSAVIDSDTTAADDQLKFCKVMAPLQSLPIGEKVAGESPCAANVAKQAAMQAAGTRAQKVLYTPPA